VGRVAILPDALANQIAAGEVVERPASVVKELVENALDAEASRITVAIEDGGRALVRVVDDGAGMSPADAVLALRRHATSKVTHAEDLAAIHSLGFRGEALPSIASVSRFRLVTREADTDVATEVVVEGGAEPVVGQAGAPQGTTVEVRDLFYNVPARLKFLKQRATETTHIQALITAVALGYPHVHVRFVNNGRVTFDHPSVRRLDQRLFQVLGKDVAPRLHEVRLEGRVRILGYISGPELTRTNQNAIHTFVNGRRVRDRTVTHALISAYGAALDRGRFPHAVLYVHVPFDEVDVNVHPTKAEIRFVHAGAVHEAISRACRATLSQHPRAGRPGGTGRPQGAGPLFVEEAPASYPTPPGSTSIAGAAAGTGPAWPGSPGPGALAASPPEPPWQRRQSLAFHIPARPGAAFEGEAASTAAPDRGQARVLALHSGWLACADAEGVYALDPRRLLARGLALGLTAHRGEGASAPLLFPQQLELPPAEAQLLEGCREVLARLGLELEPFGGATWQLIAIPRALPGAEPTRLIGAIKGLLRRRTPPVERLLVSTLAEAAADGLLTAGRRERGAEADPEATGRLLELLRAQLAAVTATAPLRALCEGPVAIGGALPFDQVARSLG